MGKKKSARSAYNTAEGNRSQCQSCGRDADGVVFRNDGGAQQACSECAPPVVMEAV